MIIKEILTEYYKKLDYLDLELIIANVIKKSREFLLTYPEHRLTKNQELQTKNLLARRMRNEPLAYILGYKEFSGLDFKVNKHTLIPRPETELLLEEALKELPTKDYPLRSEASKLKTTIVDIGTGSGNIIVSLAKQLELRSKNYELRFYGTDISTEALKIAKYNAKKHKVDKKIKFLKGNLLEPILKKDKLTNAIMVANLPYLDMGWKNLLKSSETKGLKFEPHTALYAGKDGLDYYRELAKQLKSPSHKNITLLCEIGHIQKTEMKKIFSFAKKIDFLKDLAGFWRVCKIKL